MSETYIVVGDQYAEFSRHKGVLTLSAFTKQLASVRGDVRVIIGQGIASRTLEALLATLAARGIDDVVCVGAVAQAPLTHKRSSEFALITEPRRVAADVYEAELACDDAVDRLSDHVTGQHISAMLLLEAARQAIIAAVELQHAGSAESRLGMVVEDYRAEFLAYAFPIPTRIKVTLSQLSRKNSQRSMCATVVFKQAGKDVCRMHMKGSLYDKRLLDMVENRCARRAVQSLLGQNVEAAPRPSYASLAAG